MVLKAARFLIWFTDYLSGRSQMVILENVVKQSAPVTSGLAQGSLLDPVLFFLLLKVTVCVRRRI